MKKLLKVISALIILSALIIAIVTLAGIYKFNFSDSNISISRIYPEKERETQTISEPSNDEEDVDESWIRLIDEAENLTFYYPPELGADYIRPNQWPPEIKIINNQKWDCQESDLTSSLPDRTTQRTINGRLYCIKANSEGAAGSVYTNYTYSTAIGNNLISTDFTLIYPQCYNYDEPARTNCQAERENFRQDELLDKIMQTLKYWDKQTPIISEANNQNWTRIKEAILSCQVKSIMQTHSLNVTATLKNGESLQAQEPKIDEIFSIINAAKDKCGKIIMATE